MEHIDQLGFIASSKGRPLGQIEERIVALAVRRFARRKAEGSGVISGITRTMNFFGKPTPRAAKSLESVESSFSTCCCDMGTNLNAVDAIVSVLHRHLGESGSHAFAVAAGAPIADDVDRLSSNCGTSQ